MKKKTIVLMLTAALTFTLASCGASSQGAATKQEDTKAEVTAEGAAAEGAEAAEGETATSAASTGAGAADSAVTQGAGALDSAVVAGVGAADSAAAASAGAADSTAAKGTDSAIKPELTESDSAKTESGESGVEKIVPKEPAGDSNVTKSPEEYDGPLGEYDPYDVKVSVENVASGGYESAHISAVYNGKELWSRDTGSYPAGQFPAVSGLGKYEYTYYYVEKGTIICLDLETGYELWRNSDFGGSPAQWAQGWAGDGTLFVSGYDGPDLFVCSLDGKTIKKIGSFRDDYYWPYELTYYDDARIVKIVYEMSPSGEPAALLISRDDFVATEESAYEANPSDGTLYYPNVEHYLSLRSGPSTDAPMKNKIYPGTAMRILWYENNMAYVVIDGVDEEGYVNPKYLTTVDTTAGSGGSSGSGSSSSSGSSGGSGLKSGMTIYADVNEFLSLREEASTSSDVIRYLPDGAELTVLAEPQGKMVKVRDEETGLVGYVHIDFVSY